MDGLILLRNVADRGSRFRLKIHVLVRSFWLLELLHEAKVAAHQIRFPHDFRVGKRCSENKKLLCELLHLPASLKHFFVGMRVELKEFFALDVEPSLTEQEGQRHEQKA